MNTSQTPKSSPRRYGFYIFSAIIFLLLLGMMLGIAYKQGKFEKPLNLKFVTTTGNQLNRGMPIFYEGFKVGQLTRLELMPDGTIVGAISIDEKYKTLATQGSYLRTSKEKIVTSELRLVVNREQTIAYQEGAEIELKQNDMVVDLEKRLMEKLDPAVAQLTSMALQLSDPNTGLPATLRHLNGTLSEANKMLANVNNTTLPEASRLLTNVNGKLTDPRLDSLMGNLDKTVGNMKTSTDQLGKALESTNALLKKSDATLEDFRSGTLGKWLAPKRAPVP
jgi:ABC-type transporter Mla subunit MlaD